MDRHTSTQNLRKMSCGEKVNYVQTHKHTEFGLVEVRVHLSRLWTDTQVRKAALAKLAVTEPWLDKVLVHLSRLWTDTPVQKQLW